MNAMSVSPVKPPLNPGNLAVPPAAATNLTKSPISVNNSYSALNLVPENKGAASGSATLTGHEKSVDVCSKTPQTTTSNGSVSPVPSANSSTVIPVTQNCNEKTESAENLTTSTVTSKSENVAEEVAKLKVEIEEKKDNKTPNAETKENSTGVKVSAATSAKDTTAQNVSPKEVAAAPVEKTAPKEDAKENKKDEKKVETSNHGVAKVEAEISAPSPTKKSPSTETATAKVTIEETKAPSVTPVVKKDSKEVKPVAEPADNKKIESDDIVEAVPETVLAEPVVKTASPPKLAKRKAKTPVESILEEENADGRKSKRTRLPTQPYQSPIPELQFIAKLNTPVKSTPKTSNEKIIAFYKNEFLAVRNPEGSFYICQAFQNIHRSSTKIKIRWFTNLPQNIYTPDFYDKTEFDCILTNVTMVRVEKDRWKLPEHEHTRIENILKRALDVEKGVAEQPSVTEEHPDGIDLSLYKDEAQLQKKGKKKSPASPKEDTSEAKKPKTLKKATEAEKIAPTPSSSTAATKKSPRVSSYVNRDVADVKTKAADKSTKKEKKEKKKKKSKASKKQSSSSASKTDKVSSKTWEPSVKASNSSKVVLSLKKEESPAKSATPETKVSKRTSSVSQKAAAAASAAAATVTPAKRRKEEPKSSSNSAASSATEGSGKVRNAGSAVVAKINSAAMRTTKEKERKAAATANQRKK